MVFSDKCFDALGARACIPKVMISRTVYQSYRPNGAVPFSELGRVFQKLLYPMPSTNLAGQMELRNFSELGSYILSAARFREGGGPRTDIKDRAIQPNLT